MENSRVAVISIIIDNEDSVSALNDILHKFAKHVIGRMGIPYRQKNINIISVAIDAPTDTINELCGLIGRLDGVSAKATYSKSN